MIQENEVSFSSLELDHDRGLGATEANDGGEFDTLANCNVARLVGDVDAVHQVNVPVICGDITKTRVRVEVGDDSPTRPIEGGGIGGGVALGHQWMILEIGNSRMSVAPASFSAGMTVLMVRFCTTDSTA